MKKISFLLLSIITLLLAVQAKIPLEQAIRKAVDLNLGVKNSRLETRQSRLEENDARYQKWFTVQLGAYYLFKSKQMEIKLSDIQLDNGLSIPLEPMTVGAKHNTDFKLGVTQPLFTGNILSNSEKIKNLMVEMKLDQTLVSGMEISLKVKNSYFQYLLLKNKLESLNLFIKQLDLHQKKVRNFYKEELIKKSDMLETEARIREQELNREEIENQIQSEKINFRALCGIEIDDIREDYTEEIGDFPRAFSDFQSGHPFLKILSRQMEILHYQKKIVSGAYLPRLGSFAELHYARPGIDFFSDKWMLYFQGGVGLDYILFDWNSQKRKQKILDYSREKLTNQRLDFIREVGNELKQLFAAKESAEKRLEIVRSLIRIALEDIGLKEKLYQEQQISNIDYLTSLTTREQYQALEDATQTQIELIKININTLIGKYDRYLQEAK
jgi:outer membrane protein TolC